MSMLEPIMGPIWVWIFVGEYPGVPALIGGSIVFVALAAHTVYAASGPMRRSDSRRGDSYAGSKPPPAG